MARIWSGHLERESFRQLQFSDEIHGIDRKSSQSILHCTMTRSVKMLQGLTVFLSQVSVAELRDYTLSSIFVLVL